MVIAVDRIADSCGYSVPYYDLVGERPVLDALHARQSEDNFASRIVGDNGHSIDGLPALEPGHPTPGSISS